MNHHRRECEDLVRRLRVLVVDPYKGGRVALCSCVEELGYEAFSASDIDAAAKLEPDVNVAIVDHSPPWFDGARWAAGVAIPAIVLVEAGSECEGSAFTLFKSVSIADLERALACVTAAQRPDRDRVVRALS